MANNNNYREVDFSKIDMINQTFQYMKPEIDRIVEKLDDMDQADICATLCTIMAACVRNHPEIEKEKFYYAVALTLLDSMNF